MTSQYMVVRPFDNWPAGAVVDASEFVTDRRARQLVDTRYLTEFEGQQALPDLLSTPISKLRTRVADTDDIDELAAALATDERTSAQKIFEARIRELTDE